MSKKFWGGLLTLVLFVISGAISVAAEPLLPPVPGGRELDDVDNPANAIFSEEIDVAAMSKKPVVGTEKNPLVNKIIVRQSFVTPSEIKALMGTREGALLDRKVLEEDFQRLYKIGKFADVQIKEEKLPENKVNIIVLLREKNIVRRIAFRGNDELRPGTLQKLIKSKAGDRYDEGQATRDARAIEEKYRDKFFYFAKVKLTAEPFEDGVKLVFDIDEGGKIWVRDIVLRGNYRFTDKTIQTVMKTKESTFFTRGKIERRTFEEDLERIRMFYQSNGYLDVTVTERPFQVTANDVTKGMFGRRELYIYIDIDEGEQYRIGSVSFEGNKLVADDDIRSVLKTMPGKIYSPVTSMEDSRIIRDIYGDAPNSRYFTKVNPERVLTEQENVVDVVFHIQESAQVVIEDVQIVGNVKTKDKVFRRELDFYPGELIDSKKINKSTDNIRNLDYVKADTLDISVREGSAPDRGVVVVNLEEKSTGNVNFGVGVSNDDPIAGQINLTQRNFDFQDLPTSFKEFITGKSFVGAGQYASISMSMGTKSKNIGFDFMNPWIFNKPIGWGFGSFWKTYEWDEFTDERVGFYTTLAKRLWWKELKGAVTYRLENVNMTDLDPGASPVIVREQGSNLLSSVGLTVGWDSRNNVFDPEKGVLASNSFKLYGGILGGHYDFWSNSMNLQGFYPFFTDRKDRNWVISARTGFSTMDQYSNTDHIPVYETLYAGGIGSVRGWRANTLGPHDNDSAIGGYSSQMNSVEIFVPVYEKLIKGSWFFDAGGVFPDAWSISGGEKAGVNGGSGYRASTGFGLHVKTPLSPMPIRVYFPITLNKQEGDSTEVVQFTFGAAF